MSYYMMSDIHTEIKAFQEKLNLINFNGKDTQLMLLGDYTDHKYKRHEVYPLIINFAKGAPQTSDRI